MATNSILQRLHEPRWRKGFANVLYKESRDWWHTRRWWIHLAFWMVVLNLAVAAPLWLQPSEPPAGETLTAEEQAQWLDNARVENRVSVGVRTLVDASGLLLLFGVVIGLQNAIIDERVTGTGAWILSKPVSRGSFILAKLAANALAFVVLAVVLPWTLAYFQICLALGSIQPILPYVLSMILIALNLLFWLTLTLMLGALFNNRGLVLAIPLAVLFALITLTTRVPGLIDYTPLAFILDMPDKRSLIQLAIQGQPLVTIVPIIGTIAWMVIFVGVAIWRFEREEF